MNTYFIMDGRAHYDTSAAIVIEAFESKNAQTAQKYAYNNYINEDAVLVDAKTHQVIYFEREL